MRKFICRGGQGSIEGLPDWLAMLLLSRGVNTPGEAEAFLHPDLSQLTDEGRMCGMDRAASLLRELIRKHARITVYGDYDADGVCAAAILAETLKALGARAEVYLPDRHSEGYGLNESAVRSLAGTTDCIVTVDCGITNTKEVEIAKSLNLCVIVTDHHLPPESLPAADAVVNPRIGGYPFPFLCGAGIAWKLSRLLRGDGAADQMDLAALATVADMVPLLDENRVIAALGLQKISQSRRPGLRALMRVCGIEGDVGSEQVAFGLAPRLNACGRMASATEAYRILTTVDEAEAEALAQRCNELNQKRRDSEQAVLCEAEKQASAEDLYDLRVIVVCGENWESGVVGLAAGRLAERYGYPALVLSKDGDVCVGSARSAGGVDIHAALKTCEDLFIRFGGHRQAAGLTLRADDIPAFRKRFSDAVKAQLDGRPLVPETEYDAEMPLSLLTPENVGRLRALAPHGIGNPAPVFLLREAEVLSARAVGANGAHLRLTLAREGVMRDGVAFGMGARAAMLSGEADVAFAPSVNEFRGRVSAECRVQAIEAARPRFLSDPDAETRMLLQDISVACRIYPLSAQVQSLRAVPDDWMRGAQGTLLFCRTADTALAMHERFPLSDVAYGVIADPRAYNTVLHGAIGESHGPYRRAVCCDGLAHPCEGELLSRAFPQAALYALPITEKMRGMLSSLTVSVDGLRTCYAGLRANRPAENTPRGEAMLRILEELCLIQKPMDQRLRLLEMRKCNPDESMLYRTLCE